MRNNIHIIYVLAGCIFILFLCLPYLLLGEDSYITVHDNLDIIISHLKLLKDNHALFNSDAVLPIMGGVRRSSFTGNEWNLTLIPFVFLPCYWANVINIVIVKLTAFIGLFLLLRSHMLKNVHLFITTLMALAFACIPYNYATLGGLSAAGVPLLIYAFLNLQKHIHIYLSYIVIIYYALGSFLIFSGVFIIIYLFAYGLYLFYTDRKINYFYLSGFILLCLLYVLTNFDLFYSFFLDSSYVSNRFEFDRRQFKTVKGVLGSWWNLLLYGHYHAGRFYAIYAIVAYLISLMLRQTKKMWLIGGIWLSVVGFVLIAKCLPFVFPSIHLFHEFQFDRVYFLYSTICFVMFALSIDNMCVITHSNRRMACVLSIVLVLVMTIQLVHSDKELIKNWKHVLNVNCGNEPTYCQFYAEDIFNEICSDLQINNRREVKVVSLAMHPAIAEYNGFYCIDGYMSEYPLSYKHAFRRIIASELEKDSGLHKYFDYWGNRCYIFSAENGRNFLRSKNESTIIRNLDINKEVLIEMGGQYIFSSVPINSNELLFLNSYDTAESFWRIYVYQIQ